MKLTAPKQERRPRRHFEGPYTRPRNRQGEEDIRIAQRIVIEKVLRAGAEVVSIYRPPFNRNSNAKLMLFITLAAQRNEIETLGNRESEQRSRNRRERRSLIKPSIESMEDNVHAGD